MQVVNYVPLVPTDGRFSILFSILLNTSITTVVGGGGGSKPSPVFQITVEEYTTTEVVRRYHKSCVTYPPPLGCPFLLESVNIAVFPLVFSENKACWRPPQRKIMCSK